MKKIIGCLLGMCLWAGCESVLPEKEGTDMPEGMFVVDYAAEPASNTRIIHDNQTKGIRVNSLTYLLYDEDGVLVKRREIPGLDGDIEAWPLRRENMTWEQREALKDTLSQNETYHAMFVANVDSVICGWKDATGKLWSPLRDVEAYDKVHLQMPLQPFHDRNMFYLFTQDICSADQSADRERPYQCPVQLQRWVTRTDMLFKQLPEWDQSGGDDAPATYPVPCMLPETIKNYFQADFMRFVMLDYKDEMDQFVVDATDKFLAAVVVYFRNQSLIPGLLDTYKPYIDRINTLQNVITGNGRTAFLDQIHSDIEAGNTFSNYQIHLTNLLLNGLEKNAQVRSLFDASAKRTLGTFASLVFEGQSGATSYYLGKKQPTTGLAESPRIQADTVVVTPSGRFLQFNYVGLSDTNNNKMAKVRWYATAEALQHDLELQVRDINGNTSLAIGKGMNEKCSVVYHPMGKLSLKNDWTKQLSGKSSVHCNLRTAIPFEEKDKLLIEKINDLLKESKLQNYTTSKSLDQMILDIAYPDMAEKGMLVIEEVWEVKS